MIYCQFLTCYFPLYKTTILGASDFPEVISWFKLSSYVYVSYLGHSFLMWVNPLLQNNLQKEKVKAASELKQQHHLEALSLKELKKM